MHCGYNLADEDGLEKPWLFPPTTYQPDAGHL